jgi:hypothetical protein
LGVALLFNRSFPSESAAIAAVVGTQGSVVGRTWEYFSTNHHSSENAFAEVLFDFPNQFVQSPGVHVSYPSYMSQTTISTTSPTFGLDMNLLSHNGNGRSWGYVNGVDIDTSTASTAPNPQGFRSSEFLTSSPIVLDLDGNGVIDATGGEWRPHPAAFSTNLRLFDIDGDGLKEMIEWIGTHDAFLTTYSLPSAFPIDGEDLFGSADGWSTGFAKLANLDANIDNFVAGAELAGLNAWQDVNQDANATTSEIVSVSALGITSISVQYHDLKSTFTRNSQSYTCWDWYPNVIVGLDADDVAVSGLPAPSLTIAPTTPAFTVHSGQTFTGDAAWVASNGIEDAELGFITNNGYVVFTEKVGDPASEAAGRHQALVFVNATGPGTTDVRRIELPAADIVNVMPLPGGHGAIVIANTGTMLLEALFNGTVRTLYQATPGSAGFRFGASGSITGGSVNVHGAYYTGTGVFMQETVASFPLSGGSLVAGENLRALLSGAGKEAVGRSLSAANRLYFVGASSQVEVFGFVNNTFKSIENGTRFGGMWGSNPSLLYILEQITPGIKKVNIFDTATNATTTIATGAYAYPVLSENGNVAVFAQYAWSTASMTYHVAKRSGGFTHDLLLNGVPVGPLRLSEDGLWYAYISTQGLVVGTA